MPPDWWMRRYMRMTRNHRYGTGKWVAEYTRRQAMGPDGAVKQDDHASTRERSVPHDEV